MKKYYWLGVGVAVGLTTVIFAYNMLNVLLINGSLNGFAVVGVIVVYAAVLYVFGLIYDKLK